MDSLRLVLVLLALVVLSLGVSSAHLGTFCSTQCNLENGQPSCGNGPVPIVRTVNPSVCYSGPGVFRGWTKFASYSVLSDKQSPNQYAVVFFSSDDCNATHRVATTSMCPLGRCCLGDFMIPPSPQDLNGDVGFFFVQ